MGTAPCCRFCMRGSPVDASTCLSCFVSAIPPTHPISPSSPPPTPCTTPQVMRAWPFKQAILRGGSQGQDKYRLPVSYLFHFGGTEPLREALFMTNRLTGWVGGRGRGVCCAGRALGACSRVGCGVQWVAALLHEALFGGAVWLAIGLPQLSPQHARPTRC